MPDLTHLLDVRLAAWSILGTSNRRLREMRPARRLQLETASETFREADAEIIKALRGEPGPVELENATLHLTGDRLNFVVIDRATGKPLGVEDADYWGNWQALLYRYPKAAS